MKSVSQVREAINDHFHGVNPFSRPYAGFASGDAYAAYYTSMYLIQDTAEALLTHRELGFSRCAMTAYLEYWGLMQAVCVQQDAICELYGAVLGSALNSAKQGGAWDEIRKIRNITAGHPSKSKHAQTRSFMGCSFGN